MNETTNQQTGTALAGRDSSVLLSGQRPTCHFTPMSYELADDGCQQVDFWECRHCGHTKEISRTLAG
jgi:hypothetical protein